VFGCCSVLFTDQLFVFCRFVLATNFIACFACCILYYAEYRRETFLIEYLDANPAERFVALLCCCRFVCSLLTYPRSFEIPLSRTALHAVLQNTNYGFIKALSPPLPLLPPHIFLHPFISLHRAVCSALSTPIAQRELGALSRNLQRVALFTFIFFAINVLVSAMLLFLPQADLEYGVG
jgi:hypothetical protein